MGCVSPQMVFFQGPGERQVPCGICRGCIHVQAQLNRERQRAWFNRMKGRFHNG